MSLIVDIYGFIKKPYVPLIIIMFLLLLFVIFDGYQLLNLQLLQYQESQILTFVGEHWLLSPLLFMLIYAAFVGISAPGAFILPIIGGFLFGPLLGATVSIVGAFSGAMIIYEIMHRAIGNEFPVRRVNRIVVVAFAVFTDVSC